MSTTARDLIKGSLRLIGALATGETPSSDELTEALAGLNDMIDSWSTESLVVYARTREELSWVGGQQSRTWGDTGNFTSARPQELESASILQGTTELPLKILTPQEWQGVSQKTLSGTIPVYAYLEPTFPNATAYLWPVPSSTVTFVANTLKPISTFASINTTVSLPPGYARALRYNFAIELAPEYGKPIADQILRIATDAKAYIKRRNSKPRLLSVDPALTNSGRINFLTGEPL